MMNNTNEKDSNIISSDIHNSSPYSRIVCKCPEIIKSGSLNSIDGRCLKKDLNCTIKKLYKLISDPIVNNNVSRISRLLYDFLNLTDNEGYHVKHLPVIMQILEFLTQRAKEVEEYQNYLERMLELCSLPPILEKNSESLFCTEILEQYFTLLGYLMVVLPRKHEVLKVHKALHCLLVRSRPVSVSAVKLELCHRAVEKSRLPIIMIEFLEISTSGMILEILNLTFLLVSISYACCYRLLEAGILNNLLIRLDPNYTTRLTNVPPPDISKDEPGKENCHEVSILVTNIIWTLMRSILPPNKLSHSLENLPAPTRYAMWSLRHAFKREVCCCQHSSESLMLRNDLAAIILAGLVALPSWKFVESGLADDLAILVATIKFRMENTWARNVTFNTSKEDLSFKKTLLLIMCHLVKFEASVAIMVERFVMPAVLQLVDPDTEDANVPWNVLQFLHLSQYALRTLTFLTPKMPSEFIKNKGSLRLLTIVEWHVSVKFDVCTVMDCIKTIFAIVTTANTAVQDDLREQGIITVLIKLINCILTFDKLTMQHQQILTLVMITLEIQMVNKKQYQQLYEEQNIKMISQLLDRCFCQRKEDFQLDQRLLIAIGTFIWECIVWCPTSLQDFVKSGTIYIMLDVIECATFPVRCVFLGALCDMCEGTFCGIYLSTWRGSDKKRGFMSLLARAWREEEIRIGVKRTPDGCIEDVELPLMGTDQWTSTYYSRHGYNLSPALIDMMTSCLAKIYSIRKIIERDSDRYQITNEHYKILLEDLPTEDLITICVMDYYFQLKQDQIWIEVSKNLEHLGVNPLGMDGEMMFLIIQRHRNRGIFIKSLQENLLKAAKKEEVTREKETFARIRDSKLAPALDALKEIDFMCRTSNRNYMIEEKELQKRQVNAALRFPSNMDGEHCHRTFFEKSNVTAILGQNQFIRSVQTTNENFGKMKLISVSPSSSDMSVKSFSSLIRIESDELIACRDCFVMDIPCLHHPRH